MKYVRRFRSLQLAKDAELFSPLLTQIDDNGQKISLLVKIGTKDTPIEIKGDSLNNLSIEEKIEVPEGVTIHYVLILATWSVQELPADKVVVPPYTLTSEDLPRISSDTWGGWDKSVGDVITDNITISWSSSPCLVKDTPITLAIGTTKMIQDITYNDELLVWNFNNAKFASAKPLWIMAKKVSDKYWLCKFKNGLELKMVGPNGHKVFNYTDQVFAYPQDCIGKEIYTESGLTKLVSCELINEPVEYYNIITNYHMNLFANSILTSCRYNNIYTIEKMKFVKDGRAIIPYSAYNNEIPEEYYIGLRLDRLPIDINKTIEYVHRLVTNKL